MKPRGGFNPAQIAAIAAGYWWDRRIYTGLGTAGFTIPERNLHTTFDRVQATLGAQPVAGTGYLRYPATLGHDSTAGAVQEGWTTKTTVAMWWRFPAGITLTASRTNSMISHYAGAGTRRVFIAGLTDAGATVRQIRGIYSTDGSAVFQYFWRPTIDTDWHFGVWLIDPSNADATLRMRYWQDLVEITASATASGGASLFNGNAVIESAGNAALSTITPDDLDIATEYIFPGELTAAEMAAVMAYENPKG